MNSKKKTQDLFSTPKWFVVVVVSMGVLLLIYQLGILLGKNLL